MLGQAIDTWTMQRLAEGLVNLYARDGKDAMYAVERTAKFLLELFPPTAVFVSVLDYIIDMSSDYTAKQHADADEYLFELEEYRRAAQLWAVMIQGALLSGHIDESQTLRNKAFALVESRVEDLEI